MSRPEREPGLSVAARLPRPAWVAITCAVLFVLLGFAIVGRGSVGFDASMTATVQGLPVSTDAWLLFTDLGGPVLTIIGAALVLTLAIRGRMRDALVFALAILGASVWTYVVKVSISRPRPPGTALVEASGFSFPSGHTLNSTVTYGLVALLVWRSGWPRWVRAAIVMGLAVLVVLIGCSRIALGVHYPSDVVGGWLAGIAVVATVAALTVPGTEDGLPDRELDGSPPR